MRRKRKTKYTWLPPQGTSQESGAAVGTIRSNFIDLNSAGNPVVGCIPCIFDEPQDQPYPAGTEPLVNLLGNEYFLRRIVGKVFVNLDINQEGTGTGAVSGYPAVIATAGFFVARCDPANLNQPIEFTTQSNVYDPQAQITQREPWIWRRSWLLAGGDLGLGLAFADKDHLNAFNQTLFTAFPSSNIRYPGVLDGPHVDAKTARRVRQHERLFFGFSAQTYPIGSPFPTLDAGNTIVYFAQFGLDCRYLGALRRARNRGSFD